MGQANCLDKGNMVNLIYLELSEVIEIVLLQRMLSKAEEDKQNKKLVEDGTGIIDYLVYDNKQD